MMTHEAWLIVNLELIAKSIGELTFEEILKPVMQRNGFELTLQSGVTYQFTGWMSVWDHLKVNPASIRRNGEAEVTAAQFFIDSQSETNMTDIVLGNFLEEMHNTLYSDICLSERKAHHEVSELATWSGDKLQTILNGHPKILLNKGRVGWGESDLMDYAPESAQDFQLHWVAAHKSLLSGEELPLSMLDESFDSDGKMKLFELFKKECDSSSDFSLLPVHPWQWNRFIRVQFAGLIAQKKLISLGAMGDFYRPQISIRTLSNTTRPEKLDIKLPLTILNTSCIRGIPAKTITVGTKISKKLQKIVTEDSFLRERGTEILMERAGVALLHPHYSQIKDAPYRYHEYLGAIWRESSESKVGQDELAIITASLTYQDMNNKSLIGEYIKRSGMKTSDWLRAYFEVVVLPLYHLQLEYGVGMVAHGQNIILKLKNFRPVGVILKDFQGDLRLCDKLPPKGLENFADIQDEMTKLPPHYLIHDLLTGHFITVLRFVSEVMQESDRLDEKLFYGILADVLKKYMEGKEISASQNLLMKTIPRVLLNKVRFHIGYSDSSERPLPMVGSALNNPLYS